MNAFQLKIFACLLMVVDHIGVIFFPQVAIFRIIGRGAFPIFAYLLGEGVRHTKNPRRYLSILFAFALISEPIYCSFLNIQDHNIFFTLFVGLSAILIYRRITNRFAALLVVMIISVAAELAHLEYGFYGVLMIFILSIFPLKTEFLKILSWLFFLTIVKIIFTYIKSPFGMQNFNVWYYIQIYSLAALPVLLIYNGKRGPIHKYAFYIFYPLHIALLAGLKTFLIK